MDLELKGKTALVTGASAGIGRAIAVELAKEGVKLVITGRRREELEKLAKEIGAVGMVGHDGMDAGYAAAIVNACKATLGGVDILMHTTGGSRAFGNDGTDQQWDDAFTLTSTRHPQLTLRFLPGMQEKKWGRIVYITGKQEP